jgi:hypothetical protein
VRGNFNGDSATPRIVFSFYKRFIYGLRETTPMKLGCQNYVTKQIFSVQDGECTRTGVKLRNETATMVGRVFIHLCMF